MHPVCLRFEYIMVENFKGIEAECMPGMKRISDKRTKNQAKKDKTEHGMERVKKAKVYVNANGHVDISDMVDIDLFTVVALNMMVVKLGYMGESEPLFYNYLRPLASLDEGLYALACEEDARCLATLVISFKLIEVYIEHGVMVVDSYNRPPPRFKATTIEEVIDEPGSIEYRSEKMLLLTWHDSSEPTKEHVFDSVTPRSLPQHDSSTPCKDSVCESVTPKCMPHCMLTPLSDESVIINTQLSSVQGVDTQDHVIEDEIRQLSFEETELDGEAGFGDVVGSGIESFGLSHDESFGVEDLDLNLNEHEPIMEEGNSQEDAEQGNGQEDESAPSDGHFFYYVEGIYTT
ncbi:hypothetical protein Tco_0612193 [Tanacetum coccineum]